MNLVELVKKEKNLIGFANKVISFRTNIINACKAKSIEPPTDEQISDYINEYGFHFEDFMADYTEHEGMFRCLKTPLEEFKMEINKISWYNKPTEDEILAFFNKYGNNIKLFCEQRTINEMKPIERKLFFATIDKLTTAQLVALWNLFIEESAMYGEDSCIIDLKSKDDMCFLNTTLFAEDEKAEEKVLNWKKNDVRYIQWCDGGELREVKDIKRMFIAFWGDIYERIIGWPSCYVEFADNDGNKVYYLDDVLAPIIRKEIEK